MRIDELEDWPTILAALGTEASKAGIDPTTFQPETVPWVAMQRHR